jgi:hypothetical protein
MRQAKEEVSAALHVVRALLACADSLVQYLDEEVARRASRVLVTLAAARLGQAVEVLMVDPGSLVEGER